jgi:hypothetical protein
MDFLDVYTGFLGFQCFLSGFMGFARYKKPVSQLNNNLQSSEFRQVAVAVCGRQCAVDCRIVVQIPTHK